MDPQVSGERMTSSPSGDDNVGDHRRGLARSTAFFAAATALSRVLGLVREMVSSYFFGVTGLINAFTVAFQIPNLVRALVADAALSGAFVPVFSQLLESGDKRRAWRVASTIVWLVLIGLTALTAVMILLAPVILPLFGNPGGDVDLATGLAQVLFPIVALLGLSGIVVGILNAYDHFSIPALTPVAWNIVIIGGLAVGVPLADTASAELYVYAGAIVVATLVQLLMPLPMLRGLDGRIRPVIEWRDPAVRQFFALMLPVTLTLGLINVNAVIASYFASNYIDGNSAPTAIDRAFRLYMLPQGMFAVAVTTVLFPTLSRLAVRKDHAGYRRQLDDGLRMVAFLLVPASLVLVFLAEPITRLIYQRGAFEGSDTTLVAACVAAFCAGLLFNGWMLLLNRGFYALQVSWIPTIVAVGSLVLNVLLNIALYRVGAWGLPLATSIANGCAVAALLVFMKRRAGLEGAKSTALSVLRILAVSAVAAAAAYGAWRGLDAALGRSLLAQLVGVGGALTVAGALYLGLARIVRVRELRALRALRGQVT